jgi:CHAD domain-containing protein
LTKTPAVQRERELKFELPTNFQAPAAEELAGRPVRTDRSDIRLESTYYDTAQFALLRHRITLRRREGDDDTGWHLKVPAGSARTEIRLPLAAGEHIPVRIAELVNGLAAGEDLAPVAIVKTVRHRTEVFDGAQLLFEIADDDVRGTALGAIARATSWQELEVELGVDDERLLAKVSKRLVRAGATQSASASKLARTLDWTDPVQSAGLDPSGLFARYFGEQLLEIGAGDVALRRGLDPVHKTRVATRRFRSTLRVFKKAFRDPEQAQRLDDELSWYQDLLGEVRDRQVLRERFGEALSRVPPELALGPVAATIEETLLGEQLVAAEEVSAALHSERYQALIRTATQWAALPPLRPDMDVTDVVDLAERAQRKARKRLKQARAADYAALLHRARKAIKRARYAVELTAPLEGKRAKKTIKRYKQAQDVLGEHQDSVIATGVLRRLGAIADNGFTFGLLYEQERAAAAQARGAARALRL